jgi:hypothetical protein
VASAVALDTIKQAAKKNPERGRKKNAFLVKAGRKMKAAEVIN